MNDIATEELCVDNEFIGRKGCDDVALCEEYFMLNVRNICSN